MRQSITFWAKQLLNMAYTYGQTMGIPVGTSCTTLIEGLFTVVLSVYLLFLPNDAMYWSLVCDCCIPW